MKSLLIKDFAPVTTKRIAAGMWVVKSQDKKLAWFGTDPFEVVCRAQTYLQTQND